MTEMMYGMCRLHIAGEFGNCNCKIRSEIRRIVLFTIFSRAMA